MFNWKIPEVSDREWMQPALSASGGMGERVRLWYAVSLVLRIWHAGLPARWTNLALFWTTGQPDLSDSIGPGDLRSKVELVLADAKRLRL